MDIAIDDLNRLLGRSAELEATLNEFLALMPFDQSDRRASARVMCGVSFEHAESVKMLLATGNFTSALGLLRLQYEALVRAFWLLYAATDDVVSALMSELTHESARKADKIPMLGKMLKALDGKAPAEAVGMLQEFREYSWKPLSSFVHGGIHAVNRHGKGYPVSLLCQTLRASNGVSIMSGMLLIMLANDPNQRGKIPKIQMEFADCMPPIKGREPQ